MVSTMISLGSLSGHARLTQQCANGALVAQALRFASFSLRCVAHSITLQVDQLKSNSKYVCLSTIAHMHHLFGQTILLEVRVWLVSSRPQLVLGCTFSESDTDISSLRNQVCHIL